MTRIGPAIPTPPPRPLPGCTAGAAARVGGVAGGVVAASVLSLAGDSSRGSRRVPFSTPSPEADKSGKSAEQLVHAEQLVQQRPHSPPCIQRPRAMCAQAAPRSPSPFYPPRKGLVAVLTDVRTKQQQEYARARACTPRGLK